MRVPGVFTTLFLLGVMALAAGCTPFETKSPEEAVNEYAQAKVKMAAGDYAGAATLLERHIKANPSSEYRTDAWLLLGDCQLRLKKYPAAQQAYQNAQRDARTRAISARARDGLGAVMMHYERYGDAAKAYESALEVSAADINAPTAMMHLGRAYIRSGRWILGRDRLRKLVREYPGSPEAPLARDITVRPSNTFSVQVGAFSTREQAGEMLEKLRNKNIVGARVVWQPQTAAPYAVRVGNFVTYKTAVRGSEKLKSIEPKNFIFP